jgi:hypothetical protein
MYIQPKSFPGYTKMEEKLHNSYVPKISLKQVRYYTGNMPTVMLVIFRIKRAHIFSRSMNNFIRCKQLGITLTKMYWLLGRKSKLSTSNKLLIYKTILKSIWTYGIQLSGMASTFNTEILECFQTKALRMIVDAPW